MGTCSYQSLGSALLGEVIFSCYPLAYFSFGGRAFSLNAANRAKGFFYVEVCLRIHRNGAWECDAIGKFSKEVPRFTSSGAEG